MSNLEEIPREVRDIPANEAGDGFITHNVYAASTVGPDGRIYTRKDSVITIEGEG